MIHQIIIYICLLTNANFLFDHDDDDDGEIKFFSFI